MKTQKIKIEGDYKLPTLIQNVKTGALRIPAFQRKFGRKTYTGAGSIHSCL